jgi:hypothetical protein
VRGHPRRHCEPTGRANARPMTGSAKQSSFLRCDKKAGLLRRYASSQGRFTCDRVHNDQIQISNSQGRMERRIRRSSNLQIRPRDLATHGARALHLRLRLLPNRGRREDRVRAAPAVSRAFAHRKCAREHTGSAGTLRPSLRSGFTAYSALSPVNGLDVTVTRGLLHGLGASIAAPGPHDFAVREQRFVQRKQAPTPPASTASHPNAW